MKMVPCMLVTTLIASSCYLSKNYVGASPVPRYTAHPPRATESSAAAGVYNKVAHLAPSSSSSGLRPAITSRDQMLTVSSVAKSLACISAELVSSFRYTRQDEGPTATIPQAKQQQQQEEGEEGDTTAAPSTIDMVIVPESTTGDQSAPPQSAGVLAQVGSCGPMGAVTRTSLAAGGAGVTDGTALPAETVITSYVVGPVSTSTGTVGVRTSTVLRWSERGAMGSPRPDHDGPPHWNNAPGSSNDVQLPPAVLLWMQCVLVAAEVLWIIVSKVRGWVSHSAAISKVRSWVSHRAGPRADNEDPDRQDSRARGDAPGESDGVASTIDFRDADGSVDKSSSESSSTLFCELKEKIWWPR
ncbi:hypothetical protein BJY52DRAFT_1306426 [Lactarius psammicola]|nr:hypothetical protein BJY52DRAFT_1306426 [Lactarius psammicola]